MEYAVPPQRRLCFTPRLSVFSSVFVSVCLLATSRKNYQLALVNILPDICHWTRKSPLNFGSRSGMDWRFRLDPSWWKSALGSCFQCMCVLLFRNVRDRERRYLSEAGCCAFDEVRRLYVAKRIRMVDASIQCLPEHMVSESELVVDVCAVLIGLPSRSFHWSRDDMLTVSFRV